MPEGVKGVAKDYRTKLVEAIVETDDTLMARYLNSADPDPLAKASRELGTLLPMTTRQRILHSFFSLINPVGRWSEVFDYPHG